MPLHGHIYDSVKPPSSPSINQFLKKYSPIPRSFNFQSIMQVLSKMLIVVTPFQTTFPPFLKYELEIKIFTSRELFSENIMQILGSVVSSFCPCVSIVHSIKRQPRTINRRKNWMLKFKVVQGYIKYCLLGSKSQYFSCNYMLSARYAPRLKEQIIENAILSHLILR